MAILGPASATEWTSKWASPTLQRPHDMLISQHLAFAGRRSLSVTHWPAIKLRPNSSQSAHAKQCHISDCIQLLQHMPAGRCLHSLLGWRAVAAHGGVVNEGGHECMQQHKVDSRKDSGGSAGQQHPALSSPTQSGMCHATRLMVWRHSWISLQGLQALTSTA